MLSFAPVASLEPGQTKEYEVFVRAVKPGDVRFRIEVRADQLESGPVIQMESTRIFAEEGVPAIPQSRDRSRPVAYQPTRNASGGNPF